jgi:hypothetical protein
MDYLTHQRPGNLEQFEDQCSRKNDVTNQKPNVPFVVWVSSEISEGLFARVSVCNGDRTILLTWQRATVWRQCTLSDVQNFETAETYIRPACMYASVNGDT